MMINRFSFRRGPENRRTGKGPDENPPVGTKSVPEAEPAGEKQADPEAHLQHTQAENDKLFLRAQKVLRKSVDPNSIDIHEFVGKRVKVISQGKIVDTVEYTQEMVQRAQDKVDAHKAMVAAKELERVAGKPNWLQRRWARIDRRNYERALMAEKVLTQILPTLLPGAEVVRACDYDDRKNGMDLIVLFRNEKSGEVNLAWGIDITSASDTDESLSRKMVNSLRRFTRRAPLARAEFVETTRPDGTKEYLSLKKVSKVILGMSEDSIRHCAQSWLDGPHAIDAMKGTPFHAGILKAIRDGFQGQLNLVRELRDEQDTQELFKAEMETDEALLKIQTIMAGMGMARVKDERDRTRKRVQGLYLSSARMREYFDVAASGRRWEGRDATVADDEDEADVEGTRKRDRK